MKKIFSLLIISAMGIFWLACKTTQKTQKTAKTNPPQTMTNIDWSILKAGNMGTGDTTRNSLIKTSAAWKEEWNATNSRFMPIPPMPEVDFGKYWVIACHAGMRSNGGYTLTVEDIKAGNDEISVSLLETAPGKNCMSADVITHPFVYVKIAHFTQPKVTYIVEKVKKDCP